jgi:hypothetical protein
MQPPVGQGSEIILTETTELDLVAATPSIATGSYDGCL